ncbi:hypothetical protein D3C84_671930 [compost metagenome]
MASSVNRVGLVIRTPVASSIVTFNGDCPPPLRLIADGVNSSSLPCSVPKYRLLGSPVLAQSPPLRRTLPITIAFPPVASGRYKLACVPTCGMQYITFPVGGANGYQFAFAIDCSLSISRCNCTSSPLTANTLPLSDRPVSLSL